MTAYTKYLQTKTCPCSIRKHKIHIKVNTGMNRYGISNIWQLKKILTLAQTCSTVEIDGLYTQFAHSIGDPQSIDEELKRFAPFRSMVKNAHPRAIIHAACTNSIDLPATQFDMVRVGKLFYGGYDGYKTAIKITSKIAAVQTVPRGGKIGYNATETAKEPMTVAVVPCGYADLIHYRCSNTYHVLVGSTPCKIMGRVCMDSIIIDVTAVANPIGKTVTIMDDKRGVTLMDLARQTHTIVCNILCSFHFDRVRVIYKK